MTIEELNQHFAIHNHLQFVKGKGDLPIAIINNQLASASVSLYGAHIMSFQPKSSQDLLWMSPQSAFEIGKPIRGGIPVCFPWFGPNPSDPQLPVHGFARLQMWKVKESSITYEAATRLVLELQDTSETKKIWPYSFLLELEIIVGRELQARLRIQNIGSELFTITNSLHTYFKVSSLQASSILGLSKLRYVDPAKKDEVFCQDEERLKVLKEENRRYIDHEESCVLEDDGLRRSVFVQKEGSKVTVVWNPWKETVKNIGDIPDEEYLSFVCIEQANSNTDTITLAPRAMHVLGLKAGVKEWQDDNELVDTGTKKGEKFGNGH